MSGEIGSVGGPGEIPQRGRSGAVTDKNKLGKVEKLTAKIASDITLLASPAAQSGKQLKATLAPSVNDLLNNVVALDKLKGKRGSSPESVKKSFIQAEAEKGKKGIAKAMLSDKAAKATLQEMVRSDLKEGNLSSLLYGVVEAFDDEAMSQFLSGQQGTIVKYAQIQSNRLASLGSTSNLSKSENNDQAKIPGGLKGSQLNNARELMKRLSAHL